MLQLLLLWRQHSNVVIISLLYSDAIAVLRVCHCSEGGDSDTRRRAAADLVRALTDSFEAQVTQLFTGYVGALLQVGGCMGTSVWNISAQCIHVDAMWGFSAVRM